MRPLLRGLFAGALLAGLLAALAFGLTRDPRVLPGAVVGGPAPKFDLAALDAERLRLADLRGRPVVINFWASWCTECRKEHPLLMQAHERFKRRVQFVGIVFQDDPDNIRDFLAEMGERPKSTYPNLLDPGSRTAIDFGVYGVPETFFIDRDGIVRYKRVGRLTPELLAAQLARIVR
jgi:cytochrome c biogenesis protein CcmG/thiol:disulfide interchange protein DsbE